MASNTSEVHDNTVINAVGHVIRSKMTMNIRRLIASLSWQFTWAHCKKFLNQIPHWLLPRQLCKNLNAQISSHCRQFVCWCITMMSMPYMYLGVLCQERSPCSAAIFITDHLPCPLPLSPSSLTSAAWALPLPNNSALITQGWESLIDECCCSIWRGSKREQYGMNCYSRIYSIQLIKLQEIDQVKVLRTKKIEVSSSLCTVWIYSDHQKWRKNDIWIQKCKERYYSPKILNGIWCAGISGYII